MVAEAGGGGLLAAAVLTVVAVVLMAEVRVVFESGRMERRGNAKRETQLPCICFYIYYFPFFIREPTTGIRIFCIGYFYL